MHCRKNYSMHNRNKTETCTSCFPRGWKLGKELPCWLWGRHHSSEDDSKRARKQTVPNAPLVSWVDLQVNDDSFFQSLPTQNYNCPTGQHVTNRAPRSQPTRQMLFLLPKNVWIKRTMEGEAAAKAQKCVSQPLSGLVRVCSGKLNLSLHTRALVCI